MLMKSVLATILAIASLLSCTKQYDVTLSDLLDEMTDRYSCCEYPEIPFKSMMISFLAETGLAEKSLLSMQKILKI